MSEDKDMDLGREVDRLSILEKIERGEVSIEDAEIELAQVSEETSQKMEEMTPQELAPQALAKQEGDNGYVLTRRERKLALGERFQNWEPQMMVGMPLDMSAEGDGLQQWPWPEKKWQWMWQNFDYPVYIGHSIDVSEGSELKIVLYQGDLFISGWDEPTLKINGAAFDVRTGQEENIVRVASSTGQLQIWVPNSISRVEAQVSPGDIWLRNIGADLDIHCQSGDFGGERIKGNVVAHVNGGDARLMGIEGNISVDVLHGNSDVRNISSDSVSLKVTEGNIWLSLSSVKSGEFHCEDVNGDINLLTDGELSCELVVEVKDGGRISPVILPWQQLLERSESKLHGILMGGGAFISLAARGGRIYIQEPWLDTFPVLSPS